MKAASPLLIYAACSLVILTAGTVSYQYLTELEIEYQRACEKIQSFTISGYPAPDADKAEDLPVGQSGDLYHLAAEVQHTLEDYGPRSVTLGVRQTHRGDVVHTAIQDHPEKLLQLLHDLENDHPGWAIADIHLHHQPPASCILELEIVHDFR